MNVASEDIDRSPGPPADGTVFDAEAAQARKRAHLEKRRLELDRFPERP
jgi:hypothetical protein